MTQERVELQLTGFCTAPNGKCTYATSKCVEQDPGGDAWVCPLLEMFGKPKRNFVDNLKANEQLDKDSSQLRKDLKGFMGDQFVKPDAEKMCECDAEGDT